MSALGRPKGDVMSVLRSSFNCCTDLGKALASDPLVTLIMECPHLLTSTSMLDKIVDCFVSNCSKYLQCCDLPLLLRYLGVSS